MAIRPTCQRMDMRSGQYEPQLSLLLPFLPPSPPSVLHRDPDPMQYPFRLACANNMSPIHALPVELLTRIFQLGVDSEPLPDDRDPSHLTFEVSISHVCRHWRQVALHTPLLWTTVHFRTKSHMVRGNLYLVRNARLPIDIYVDTCSEDLHAHRKDLLFRDEFIPVFNILLPYIDRWRELHLKVADLDCKLSARRVLSTCGSAPVLRTLQLWHVQNWQTPERLFTAIGPPPVVVFGGELPSLKHIVLQGVNLPWMSSPFLRNLTSIELALHSDDVRMPFHLWRKMLASSPALERLCLHYSGPCARTSGAVPTPDGIEWWGANPPDPDDPQAHAPGYVAPPAADPVHLPRLREIRLIDLEPDYLVAVFKSIDAPNVRALHLELETEDQDFSPFVDFLAKEPSWSLSSSQHPPHLNGHGEGEGAEVGEGEGEGEGESEVNNGFAHGHGHGHELESAARGPRFPRLETLSVSALVCSAGSWRALLESARALTRLEVDCVPPMLDGAFGVLFGTVRSERARARPPPRSGSGSGSGSQLLMAPQPNGTRHDDDVGGVAGAGETRAVRLGGAGPGPGPRRDAKGKGKERARDDGAEHEEEDAYEDVPILPALQAIRCGGIPSRDIARLAAHRRTFRTGVATGAEGAFRIRRWEVEEGFRDEDGLAFERELRRISAEEEWTKRARDGTAGEPWRWDEPLEKVVWYRDEGEYDEESDGEEEVGDTEEDGDEDGEDD